MRGAFGTPRRLELAHLLYTSKQTGTIAETDLQDILTVARHRNEAEGVTGMLLADDTSFLQLLEGDRKAIQRVYDSITRDSRHHDLHVLMEDDLADRMFPNWSMGYARTCGIQQFKWVDRQLKRGRRKSRRELAYRLLSLFRRAMKLPLEQSASLARVKVRQGP